MVTPLASRFAVLPIDDDGDTSKRITAKSLNKKKQEQTSKSQPVTAVNKSDTGTKKKQSTKKKTDQTASTKQKSKPKNETAKKNMSEEQWEQWKQKDAEFVDGHYEDDLQQAMLLSKLDYEEKQEYYDQIKKISEDEKKSAAKKNKKSNKAQPMSLSQFNQMGESTQADLDEAGGGDSSLVNGRHDADPEFFDRIKSDAKKAFQSEQAEEQRKAREPLIDELISVAQYQDRLQKCQEEISRLKENNEELQEELKNVKTRNKKLCQLLLQGETKSDDGMASDDVMLSISQEVYDLRRENCRLHKELFEVKGRNKKLCSILLQIDERQSRSVGGGRQTPESQRRAIERSFQPGGAA